jgi:hypothetical protein
VVPASGRDRISSPQPPSPSTLHGPGIQARSAMVALEGPSAGRSAGAAAGIAGAALRAAPRHLLEQKPLSILSDMGILPSAPKDTYEDSSRKKVLRFISPPHNPRTTNDFRTGRRTPDEGKTLPQAVQDRQVRRPWRRRQEEASRQDVHGFGPARSITLVCYGAVDCVVANASISVYQSVVVGIYVTRGIGGEMEPALAGTVSVSESHVVVNGVVAR